MARLAIFFFSVFVLHHHHRVTSTPALPFSDLDALRLFRSEVIFKRNIGWNDSYPVCDWIGVRCNILKSSVAGLGLPGLSLRGEIPLGSIGNLSNLRLLSLRFNRLSGRIPVDFSNLTKLTRLYLQNNSFSGPLPNLKILVAFNVSNNNFSGCIPPSLSQFDKSAFSGNKHLIGLPLSNDPSCLNKTPPPEQSEKETTENGVLVGISVVSPLLLITLLGFLRKIKINTQMKQPPKSPSTEVERNKLVFFNSGIYSFDFEDLYGASTDVLGKGTVGTSYKVVMDGGPMKVVVKRLKHAVVTESKFESTMEVLGKMKSKHVVPLVAYYYSKEVKLLVYDYVPAGSLFAHLHGSRGLGGTICLDWNQRMRIALSAARGVTYLHMAGKVVHGNIKSSNILLHQETNKHASVSDYGLNTLFGGLNYQVTGYESPEVVQTQEVTFESDVYSFGVLLLELLTGKDPNQVSLDKDEIVLFDVELRSMHQNIEEEMVQLLRIAKSCLLFEPDQRPTMHKVVKMMEDMNRVEPDEWFGQSSDDHSKAFDDTPWTENHDTSSTITPYT